MGGRRDLMRGRQGKDGLIGPWPVGIKRGFLRQDFWQSIPQSLLYQGESSCRLIKHEAHKNRPIGLIFRGCTSRFRRLQLFLRLDVF